MRPLGLLACLALCTSPLLAQTHVVRRALSLEAAGMTQLVTTGDMETRAGQGLQDWAPWELGYAVDDQVKHGGQLSARCTNATAEEHRGLTYLAVLNQTVATPIVAECWTKAESVSGGPDADYSLYLDLEYMDGTPLWGQLSPIKPGTHDWVKRTVTVVPAKPVKNVSVHCIFRRHTGTAWFDDVKAWEMKLPGGVRQFDGVPVEREATAAGTYFDASGAPGGRIPVGLYLRDVAAKSDFIQPEGEDVVAADGKSASVRATAGSLGLALEYKLQDTGDFLRVDGTVRDLTGKDRAVTVYCGMPVRPGAWVWHDDQRTSRPVEPGQTYCNYTGVTAGATRSASRYPLACISSPQDAFAVGAPLDVPRLYRFAYDPGELYGAVDLGLAPDTHNFPSSATFSFVFFKCDPKWGFRSALQRYYEAFPNCFVKRNKREGIWMPFTDIASVPNQEDFGFQFQEGAGNVAFDEEHGIYSFVYVEPVSHWVFMPKEMERTNERAVALVKEQAAAGNKQSQATLNCVIEDAEGAWQGGPVVAPWCDGALYLLDPAPGVRADDTAAPTKFRNDRDSILAFAKSPTGAQPGWNNWERGYEVAAGEGRNGSSAARMTRPAADQPSAGCSQRVVLNQTEPKPIVARVWTKAEGVTGDPDNSYALYIDLQYTDGTPLFGQVVGAQGGTHDWQLLEETIRPAKPVLSVSYHLLLRAPHTGTAWFDDAFLGLEGSDENLLKNANFEPATVPQGPTPRLDGLYFDSFEMAATNLNYRRDHFANVTIPLVFDADCRVCELSMFNTLEYAKGLEQEMRAGGRMTFANSTPASFPWGAAFLDVMGTETNWAPGGDFTVEKGWTGASNYMPDGDATMNYRRAMCYQRPYLLLMNTVFDLFKPGWIELYFKRCTAYAVFPGFFSHNAADDVYFARPALYNRDRPLFKKYIPVIKTLSAAGWEPVTNATSSNPQVYVERFGKPGGAVYLTVLNDSKQPGSATVTVDLKATGLPPTARGFKELLSGGELGADGNGAFSIELGAEDVKVFQLAP